MTRVTVSSWAELCQYIRENRGKSLKLQPVSWLGEAKVDRKTKEQTHDVDEVYSIIFEVEKNP